MCGSTFTQLVICDRSLRTKSGLENRSSFHCPTPSTPSSLINIPMPLPPEITDRIIDFLWDDTKSLRHCALTCRPWRDSSYFHLYARVPIRNRTVFCILRDLVWRRPQYFVQTEEVTIVDEDSKPYARSVPQVFGEYLPNKGYQLCRCTMEWSKSPPCELF
ncbi:hypothetical protein AcW1_002583 [Taiwanofungus camphoratus]|nr:hypothetical protein AcW1_002583 [Antrodia cinnamomea]